MPAPPGAAYTVIAKVTGIGHAAANPVLISSWPIINTVTFDNLSPANPAWNSIVPSGSQMDLSWTNPLYSDFRQVVILRDTVTVARTRSTLGNHAPFNFIDCTSCHKHDGSFAGGPPR